MQNTHTNNIFLTKYLKLVQRNQQYLEEKRKKKKIEKSVTNSFHLSDNSVAVEVLVLKSCAFSSTASFIIYLFIEL